jgi:hypothetical protein
MEIHVEDAGISAGMLNFCARFKYPQLLAVVSLCPVPIGQDVGRAPQPVSTQWKRLASASNQSPVVRHSVDPEHYLNNIVQCWVTGSLYVTCMLFVPSEHQSVTCWVTDDTVRFVTLLYLRLH